MRLINADLFKENILSGLYVFCQENKEDIARAIDCEPTVEERPQGEWIRTGSLGNGNAHYECSNCHYGDEHAESQEVPYCWHCGADMRGSNNG